MNELERELRRLLEPVELVCDAQIPDDLVVAAESIIRPVCNTADIDLAPRSFPATLVTYFAICGSQRYSFNGVWANLGVTTGSSRAGVAFLKSLSRLDLPTFQAEVAATSARRYVAPMLLHGAFPAGAAARFVDRVAQELRNGLVSAAEARRRLVLQHDLVQAIGRPATRLLEWTPNYAEQVIEALIEHIENPGGNGLARLPHHLHEAVTSGVEQRRGLGLLRPPQIVFELWSGFGPQITSDRCDRTWRVDLGSRLEALPAGQTWELEPGRRVVVEATGRSITLAPAQSVWFFRLDGSIIDALDQLPNDFTVVVPTSWSHTTSNSVVEVEHGVPLSGPWSTYRSVRYYAPSGASITFTGNGETVVASVLADTPIELTGQVASHVTASDGSPVYAEVPRLRLAGLPPGSDLPVWFEAPGSAPTYARCTFGPHGDVDLTSLLGRGATSGRITVRVGDGNRPSTPVVVVPALHLELPDKLLGPDEAANVTVRANVESLRAGRTLRVPSDGSSIRLELPELAPAVLHVPVPRLQWALRARRTERVTLAPGSITATADDLTAHGSWLLIRCGVPARVGIRLNVDGHVAQTIEAAPLRATGDAHQIAFALDRFRDTIRRHQAADIRIDLITDDGLFTAVTTGAAPTSTRRWAAAPSHSDHVDPDRAFRTVAWVGERRGDEYDLDGLDETVRDIELRLRLAGDAQAVVLFLRVLGRHAATWKRTEFPSGPSGNDWQSLMRIANSLWALDGQRLRVFASGDLNRNLRAWAHSARDELRRRPTHERSTLELWLAGRVPPFDRLSRWRHAEWVRAALPSHSNVGIQLLPATVLYHAIDVMAGDDDSGPVIASAVDVAPEMVLHVTAFLLQALRASPQIDPPEIDPLPDDDAISPPSDGVSVSTAPPVPVTNQPPQPLPRARIEAAPGCLTIRPATAAHPALRISRGGRPEYIVLPRRVDDCFEVDVPHDISGRLDLEYVHGSTLMRRPAPTAECEMPAPAPQQERPVAVGHALNDLAQLGLAATIERIERAIDQRRLFEAPVDELFNDEQMVGAALLSHSASRSQSQLDRLAIRLLAMSHLFSNLGVSGAAAAGIALRSKLLYACIAPRTAESWITLGWPGTEFAASSAAGDAWVGWVRRLGRPGQIDQVRTWRYAPSNTVPHADFVRTVVQRLEQAGVPAHVIDLTVATHRLLTVDHLAHEATRMLLDAYNAAPRATEAAVLAGTALSLLTK